MTTKRTDTKSQRDLSILYCLLTAIAVVTLCNRAYAISAGDILLYAPFDGSADATTAVGNPKAIVHGKAEFADGKFGQGYLSGRNGDELVYESKGNIDVDAGTVSLWAKPLGWSEKDPWMRFWFRAGEQADAGGTGEGTFLWLYKYIGMSPLYWLVQQVYFQRSVSVCGGSNVYHAGEWTHIAATWCGPVMRVYANGKLLGTARTPTPHVLRNFGMHFYVGGDSWTAKGDHTEKPDSVIDEFCVFRRPLTASEIASLCEKGAAAILPAEKTVPAELEIETVYLPSSDKLKVRLMTTGRRPRETDGLSTSFTIESIATSKPALAKPVTRPVQEANAEEFIDCKSLVPGKYRVVATLTNAGQACPPVSADFEKPKRPEWLGNRIGIPVKVPEPWTALRVGKPKTVECWGRKVEYANSLFPTQMTSKGQPLLTRPIRLVATQGEKTLDITNARFTWKKVTALRAEFAVEGKLGSLPVRADGWMEYDGFIWTKVSLPATAGASLDGLKLEISMRPEVATLQHGQVGGWSAGPKNGKVEAWHHALEGQPFLWLGNDDVGLQWSTGDNYCWENRQRKKTIELAPGKDECLLTIVLIDHTVPLDQPLEYTLGLQATPVKPMPKGWRSYDLGMNGWWHTSVGQGSPKMPPWAFWYQKWNAQNEATKKEGWLPGYPAVGPWTKETIEKTIADGKRPFPYSVPSWMWRGAPEYPAFHSEWNPDSPGPLPFETAGVSTNGVWRTVPSFQDWLIWRWWKTFKDNPWLAQATAGIYNDVVQPFWGPDPRPDREGLIRNRHELLGAREIQKRMYVAFQQEWPHIVISNHQSADTVLSQLAFAHVYVTGENYAGNATLGNEESYYHVMDLDSCRAELTGAKWGIPIIFLPEIQPSGAKFERVYGPEGIKPAEHLAGLLLVHDVIPWPASANPLPLMRLAALKENFGWDDATEFVGYWKSGELVKLTTDTSPVVVSIYKRPGKVMFVVMNNSDSDASITLTPDWGKLGIAQPKELTDAYTATGIPDAPFDMHELGNTGTVKFKGEAKPMETVKVPVTGGQVSVKIEKRNFRALVTE